MLPQQSIAHYRIGAKLGEGGMGAVYRASDTRLNRDVAIKVLPPAFADDSARMQRFQREAQVLASLNHPNIAQIYGVEAGAIVMELVEGPDLSGPLPLDTALDYARQIAAGLEAAHEKGVVHRDLKPANIKITSDGVVKILDFGLARTSEPAAASSAISPTLSPTLSLAMTQAGMILGTAAYMSPEQARGKVADKRADIWAFGVVLYEMLTGHALFGGGETVTDTIAAIVTREPEWSALPKDTPHHVRRLLERCLRKDPRQRLRDIGDARLALDEPEPTPQAPAMGATAKSSRLPWAACALALAAAAAGWTAAVLRPKPAAPLPVRFALAPPDGATFRGANVQQNLVPSPDGRSLAFVATPAAGKPMLWLRPLQSPLAHKLDRTEGASAPFWSPDSQYIGFFADGKLKKVPAAGGPPVSLCDLSGAGESGAQASGATWSSAGVIVFSLTNGPLQRVPDAGGSPAPVTTLGPNEARHIWPQFLPDGRRLLYFVRVRGADKGVVYIQELGASQRTKVMDSAYRVGWAPPHYLLVPRDGSLFAQHIDSKTFQPVGDPVLIADEVVSAQDNSAAGFAVSPSGVLIYRTGQQVGLGALVWFSRDGARLSQVGKPELITSIRLSPDEKSVALTLGPPGRSDLHIMDLASGVLTRMTNDGRALLFPAAWSPDSRRLAFLKRDGLAELEVASGKTRILGPVGTTPDWAPDNRFVLASEDPKHLLRIPPDGTPQPQAIDISPQWRFLRLSPDGKYIAYDSAETRPTQVFVASFPSFAEKRQVSREGGDHSVWRGDGQEIYFRAPDGMIMAAPVKTGTRLESGVPQPLFSYGAGPLGQTFWPARDGRRFLVKEYDRQAESQYIVALNWLSELKQ